MIKIALHECYESKHGLFYQTLHTFGQESKEGVVCGLPTTMKQGVQRRLHSHVDYNKHFALLFS